MFTAWTQIFKRDLLIAFRRRSEIIHPIIFFVMVISLFPLAIGDDKVLLQKNCSCNYLGYGITSNDVVAR